VDLSKAYWRRANLEGANLDGVFVSTIDYDEATKWPKHFPNVLFTTK